MCITEIITVVKDLLVSGAAIITAIVAIIGLKNWQREIKGKTEFDIARKLMQSTYSIRDSIKGCRSPFISAFEFPENYTPINKTDKEEAEALLHVYKNRWKPISKAVQEFDLETLEAEALWGKEIRTKTDALRNCVGELRFAIDETIEDIALGKEIAQNDIEYHKELRTKLYATKEKDNELSINIANSIKELELVLQPHLKR